VHCKGTFFPTALRRRCGEAQQRHHNQMGVKFVGRHNKATTNNKYRRQMGRVRTTKLLCQVVVKLPVLLGALQILTLDERLDALLDHHRVRHEPEIIKDVVSTTGRGGERSL
jgi:hypothetical protein